MGEINITVVIPTYNRPDFLRRALVSVFGQSIGSENVKVIVSDNGNNPMTKKVCDEFLGYNISYIKQEQSLTSLQHHKAVLSIAEEGLVAFTHDDDWWDENHLEIGIKALAKNPTAVAYCCAFLFCDSEKDSEKHYYEGNGILKFAKPSYKNYKINLLTYKDVFMSSYITTAFHFSGLIIGASTLKKVVGLFDNIHPHYADRIFYPEISKHGNIAYNPLPTLLVGTHEGNDFRTYSQDEWIDKLSECSNKLFHDGTLLKIDLKRMWNEVFDTLVEKDKEKLNAFIIREPQFLPHDEKIQWYHGYEYIKRRLDKEKELAIKRVLRRVYYSIKGRMVRYLK
jgi:glycosyltransferase involved in cell wall biosynthesis